jgi:hypothetical protein
VRRRPALSEVPRCAARAKWLAQREAKLLPFRIFTLPQQVGRFSLRQPQAHLHDFVPRPLADLVGDRGRSRASGASLRKTRMVPWIWRSSVPEH